MRRIALLTSLVLVVSACSGDDAASTPAATSVQETSPTSASESNAPEATASPTTAVTTTTLPAAPLLDGIEPSVDLLTEPTGGGIRPLLEWSAVDDAVSYMITVYAPDGAAYWTWTGPATNVHVGGEPVLDGGVPGPSVIDGMTWGVVAFNETFVPMATSTRGQIGP